jgi:hypothetical protein
MYEINDGAVWHWRDPEWHLVCSTITPTCVYRSTDGEFFELELIDGAGRKFRLTAAVVFSRKTNELQRALRAEGIEVFDVDATAAYLRSTIPPGPAVEDAKILPTRMNGCNADFRRSWMRSGGQPYV